MRRKNQILKLQYFKFQKKQQLKKELVAKQPNPSDLPTEDFTEEAMQEAWAAYAKSVEAEGQYNLLSHLTMGVPKLENTLIHLVFPNETIKVEVERAKHDLLGFLRKELNNYEIDLSIEVNETETKRYAYTTREKFEKLKEKNPSIDLLRTTFDLDI